LEDEKFMAAAILLTVSVVAFGQFGLYYWRAAISGVASHQISERIRLAARIPSSVIAGRDFRNILVLNTLTPDLRGPNGSFTLVRGYFSVVETLGKLIPAMASWADAEMATCARYVAVVMDQHMERNMACAAEIRGI
jgi:hypothetical protein